MAACRLQALDGPSGLFFSRFLRSLPQSFGDGAFFVERIAAGAHDGRQAAVENFRALPASLTLHSAIRSAGGPFPLDAQLAHGAFTDVRNLVQDRKSTRLNSSHVSISYA